MSAYPYADRFPVLRGMPSEGRDRNSIVNELRELATAQAAQMRMRIYTELKIRRELRPEQIAILRRLRLQARDFIGAQRPTPLRPRPNARRNAPQP